MDTNELHQWFENNHNLLEEAYIAHEEPWRQSGMSGPEERWILLRKPIADCIDRKGTFLDIGCANGYLIECCLKWTAERGIEIDPYGLDLSPKLVKMAQKRLPRYANHFFVGNGFYWKPPMKYDFVRVELIYVPSEYERAFVVRLLENFVAPGGRLLVASYGEGRANPNQGILPGCHPTRFILERLEELHLKPMGYYDGYEPYKGRSVRIAMLNEESVL